MTPIKLLARMGLFQGLLNNFDGGIEILDDLDDHWYDNSFCFLLTSAGPPEITRRWMKCLLQKAN